MPRTCSRMKPSASPKPASGPVFGLTWPILMVAVCACAGMAPNRAGAAIAPMPVLTIVRREIALMLVMIISLGWARRSSVLSARFFQVLQNFRTQCRLLFRAPLAEAFAGFEAELAVLHQFLEIRRWAGPAVDVGQHGIVDRQRQVGADHIGIFQRPEHREPAAERRLDHVVDGLGVANAVFDQRCL